MAAPSKTSLVIRRLYRNLLRTSKPFEAPSPNAAVLTCLLHRTGIDDHIQDWNAFVAQDLEKINNENKNDFNNTIDKTDKARDLTRSYYDSYSERDATNNDNDSIFSTPKQSNFNPSLPPPSNRTYQRLFRRLLREVVTGTNNYGKMVFPSQVDTIRLRKVIQREFRANNDAEKDTTTANNNNNNNNVVAASTRFDNDTRRQVAFTALRELNKKLSYYDWLEENSPKPQLPQQAAWHVSALPTHPPASYLRPGVFLVSHPYMQDSYFSKTVICILEHKGLGSSVLKDGRSNNDDDDIDDVDLDEIEANDLIPKRSPRRTTAPPGQTYGVIVNRVSIQNDTGKNRTLKEVFREHMLPERMAAVFGDLVVREGGPVHVALQMIHSLPNPSEQEEVASAIGGTIIPSIGDGDDGPALYSDKATYFQGNMFKIMSQIEDGKMDRDDSSFFVGASIWSPGQLAAEIAQGYWIPCRGPPEMALDGICEHKVTSTSSGNNNRPLADLWLSMMSACGEDEANLSHLFHPDHWDENGMPCDAFDDDDSDIVVF